MFSLFTYTYQRGKIAVTIDDSTGEVRQVCFNGAPASDILPAPVFRAVIAQAAMAWQSRADCFV